METSSVGVNPKPQEQNEEDPMAIYHLHIDSYRRSRGRTAVGGMAYRRGVKAACRYSGKHYNFRGKGEVAFSGFVNVDGDKTDYTKLENLIRLYESVEQHETHCRATVGREIEAALPVELNLEQQTALILGFIQEVKQSADAERAFFDFSIHHKPNNPHVHICMSEREQLSPFIFSKTKRRHWDGKDFVKLCRQIWERRTNEALATAGFNQRVDCRSHAERRIDLLPSMHEGRATYFNSEVKQMNEQIKQTNEELKKKQEATPKPTANISQIAERLRADKTEPTAEPLPETEPKATPQLEDSEVWGIQSEDEPSTPALRRLLKEKYSHYFGFSKYLSRVDIRGDYAVLYFKDRSQITDYGNRIVSEGSNAELAAYRMIEMALAKQWQAVSFTGDAQFLRIAFERALDKGLEIQTKTEVQQKILAELQRERQGMASGMGMAPTKVAILPIDGIQKKFPMPKPNPTQQQTKTGKKGWRRSGG